MRAGKRLFGSVPGDWADAASCKGKTDLFFPPGECGGHSVNAAWYQAAKAICRTCPVIEPCREFGIVSGERFGVFGGLDPGERRRFRANGVADRMAVG